MMGIQEIIVGFIVCILSLYLYRLKSRAKNLPPGPWGFPIVGHLPILGAEPHKTAFEWTKSKTYPPVISVNFGSIPSIIISNVKLLKDALNEPAFAGRPDLKFLRDRSGGIVKGLLFTQGQRWTEQRRFALRHLRDFGFGKKSMESIVQDEITDLIEQLRKEVGKPFSTRKIFNAAVLNALWTILTGERFKQDDPELQKILNMLITSFENNNVTAALSIFLPWITQIAPKISGYKKLMEDSVELREFMEKPIIQHKNTFQEGELRDFVDVYLQESNNTKDTASSFHPSHSELVFVMGDLFMAGAETTSTTLCWTFLYLAKFPTVQQKLQKEIDTVVGKSRLPSLSDRTSMTYTQALIHEVLRFSTIAPLAFFHSTLYEVQFAGYTIPKGTMIVPNLYAAHFDPVYWEDPDVFRPERFIDQDGNFKKNEAFLAFSYGKRVCLGETLARDELFLFITCLFQKFSVSPNPKEPELDLGPKLGSVVSPKPHLLILKERYM